MTGTFPACSDTWTMVVKKTSGVILAGGLNSRFEGFNKANTIIGGKRIIERITDVLYDIFAEIIIVTNDPEAFREPGRKIITSDVYRDSGPLGGIHAGMKVSSADSVFIFASDMPFLDKNLIKEMIASFNREDCEILVPATGDKIEPLHAIYSISLAGKLENSLGRGTCLGVNEFIKRSRSAFLELPVTDLRRLSFTNINSRADADRVNMILENEKPGSFKQENTELPCRRI